MCFFKTFVPPSLCLALFTLALKLQSEIVTWSVGQAQNPPVWSDKKNWSPEQQPDGGDRVILPVGASPILDIDAVVDELLLGEVGAGRLATITSQDKQLTVNSLTEWDNRVLAGAESLQEENASKDILERAKALFGENRNATVPFILDDESADLTKPILAFSKSRENPRFCGNVHWRRGIIQGNSYLELLNGVLEIATAGRKQLVNQNLSLDETFRAAIKNVGGTIENGNNARLELGSNTAIVNGTQGGSDGLPIYNLRGDGDIIAIPGAQKVQFINHGFLLNHSEQEPASLISLSIMRASSPALKEFLSSVVRSNILRWLMNKMAKLY